MLLRNMQVLEIMKTHVAKTTGEATLAEAADLLDLYQTTGLPVVDSTGGVQGMLTESDILRAAQTLSGAFPALQRVRDWMTAPAICIDENETVAEAARLMLKRGLKRLPVLTEGGRIVGVLNRIDLLQAVFEGAIDDVFTDGS
jgi:CBS domain-containing protein